MIAFDASNFFKPSVADQVLDMQAPVDLPKCHLVCYLSRYLASWLKALSSIHFSEIDQAFLVWGALTLFMFSLGQFSTTSWAVQAMLDAALTGVGIAATSGLTWAIATQAKLRWVVLLWAGLMTAGTVVTVYGIFYSSVLILSNLCLLWLGLCAAGYGSMAVGMRSRCFTAACLVHFGAIAFLNYTFSWQFFGSGLIMASTLFFFSFVTWDMQTADEALACEAAS